jgi:protein-disulfide isomerase
VSRLQGSGGEHFLSRNGRVDRQLPPHKVWVDTGRVHFFKTSPRPAGHTPDGGVVVGSDNTRWRRVVFEDPQCPDRRQFEDVSADLLRREVAAGAVAAEYRIRCFLGPESVRAANALALAAEAGRFDQQRREMFAAQPLQCSAGYTADDLVALGRRAGLHHPEYATAIRQGRYEPWARKRDKVFTDQDPQGTPAAFLDGQPVAAEVLYDPQTLRELVRR